MKFCAESQRDRHLKVLKSLGPAVPRTSSIEALRAGFGALIGLGLTGLFLLSPTVDLEMGLYLVAPFGASSVLLFAVPNSPLAQPWPAIVGNTVAALVAVAVCMVISDPVLRIGLAVGLAIVAMMLCRAIHPPAGAVAMTAAMNPDAISHLGFFFALSPIAVGTCILVLFAIIYAWITGRRYPFRQFDDPRINGTDAPPSNRLGLSESELTSILERYSQSFNVGVEDLARLIGAAELQAAAHSVRPISAADIMSKNLVTTSPDTTIGETADLFRQHRFTSLPVVGDDAKFLGVIFQIHLINQARGGAARRGRTYWSALTRILDRNRTKPITARDIMSVAGPRATTSTPIGALLSMMSDGEVDAVPIIEGEKIVGIITRTDLIAALARHAARHPA
jgi:CBS domain-containing membrane protein